MPATPSRVGEEPMPVPDRHFVNGHAAEAPFPEGRRPRCSAWAASGAPSASSGRRRACGRPRSATPAGFTPNPTYEEVVLGPHRPRRGRAGRVRSRGGQLRAAAQGVLGDPRPDPGHAAGQRRRHAVPLGDLLHRATPSSDGRRGVARRPYQAVLTAGRLRRDHDRDRARRTRSITPRTTTSSTSPRTRRLLRPRRHGHELSRGHRINWLSVWGTWPCAGTAMFPYATDT